MIYITIQCELTSTSQTFHLIIVLEVTNVGNDRRQLSGAIWLTKRVKRSGLNRKQWRLNKAITKVWKSSFASKPASFVPKPLTSGSNGEGRVGKQDFIYLIASDEYRIYSHMEAQEVSRAILRASLMRMSNTVLTQF